MSDKNKIVMQIADAKRIAICTHLNPDADALGSMLSLRSILVSIGKDCVAVNPGDIPENLRFLPDLDKLIPEPLEDFDLVIAVDAAERARVGGIVDLTERAKETACIDHHRSNVGFMKVNWIDPKFGSTCEMIYELGKSLDAQLDHIAATWLYAGLLMDTGRFLYNQTRPESHYMAADLMNRGIDWQDIHIRLFQSMPYREFELYRALLSRAIFHKDKTIAITYALLSDAKEYQTGLDATDPALHILRDIDEVECSCLLKESDPGVYKVSMRSKRVLDVSKIAAAFGGGGHLRAAGCTIHMPLDDAMRVLLEEIERQWAER